MTVEAIRLQNFMAFEDTGWIELRPITLLFGRNSSGKSAIIRALRLLKQSLDAPGDKGPFIFESPHGVDLASFTEMVHGGSEKECVWFHFRCTSSDIADALATLDHSGLDGDVIPGRTLQLSLGYAAHRQEHANPDPTRVELVDFQIRLETNEEPRLLFQAALLEPEDVALLGEDWYVQGLLTQGDEPGAWRGFRCALDRGFLPELVPPSQSSTHYQSLRVLLDNLEVEISAFLGGIIHLGPIRPEPQRRYSFSRETAIEWRARGWGAFLDFIGGRLTYIQGDVNAWIEKLNLGQTAESRPITPPGALFTEHEIGIRESGLAKPLPLSSHGFGISQALPVILQSLIAQKAAVVVIEQPELHLHPYAQATLGDLFIAAFQREVWSTWKEQVNKARERERVPPPQPTPEEISASAPRFIIETHSEHLILRLQRRIRGQQVRHEDVSIFYITRESGESFVHKLRLDEAGDFIDNWPEGFFEERYEEMFDRR